jgi:F-type H+-transporting ATPase subunit a
LLTFALKFKPLTKNMVKNIIFLFILTFASSSILMSQDHNHDHPTNEATASTAHPTEHAEHSGHDEKYDPAATAIHHISDANVYTILDAVSIPLPMILYAKDKGWDFFLSNKFKPGHHEDGSAAYNGYVMHHGSVHRITDPTFPQGEVALEGFNHTTEINAKSKKVDHYFAKANGQEYKLDPRTTYDGGVLGGGITSFYDLSVTKNVVSMLLVALFLLWIFGRAAKFYASNKDKAPKGATNALETIFLYIRDEVAIPFIGKDKYKKYFPLLLSIFFFILGLNLFGQIPFLGGVNVTGNLSVTLVLALIVFIIVNINGNKHYWAHIFWMPGVSIPMKILLALIEVMSLFIKPLTLMLRLAGNISAGHIAILSFIGLIFIFGKAGQSIGGGAIGTAMAIPLTLFMMAIELIVAFVQAYVFTLLTASYIGAATEEAHHDDHAHAHH